MDDFHCPACGADLLDDFLASRGTFDTVLDQHAENCVEVQREIQGKTNQAPLCAGDEG